MFHGRGLIFFCVFFLFPVSAYATVLAIVDGNKITKKDFKKKYKQVQEKSFNPPEPKTFLKDLIRYEVGVQEARKRELQKDPKVKQQFRQVMYKALVENAIGDQVEDIKVTEAEMKKYYKKHPELRTSHILIEYKADANKKQKERARQRALEIYKEVKKSDRPFSELVKLYTDDTVSKRRGGDIGYQSNLSLVPSYYKTALRMNVGQIKGIVETRYGFHIIKLTGRRKYEDANKRQIRRAVFDRKRKKLFDKYFNQLKKDYEIKINRSAVKKLN